VSLVYPAALSALLAGIGIYGVLARRNAVLMLIGVELILNSANLLLVTAGSRGVGVFAAGPVLALFVITIADGAELAAVDAHADVDTRAAAGPVLPAVKEEVP
jgi:NADH-quinone oxidoreductase subunit K